MATWNLFVKSGSYWMESSSPNYIIGPVLHHFQILAKNVAFSALPPTCTQVEAINLQYCLVFKMADELDWSSSEFSETSSSFLDSSLESSVLESEAEDSDEETAQAECKSSESQRGKTPKTKTIGKGKLAFKTKSQDEQQMEESLWVLFTNQAANNVERELWE